MFCSKCGTEITSKDKICPKCGAINICYCEPESEDSTHMKKYQLKPGFWKYLLFFVIIAGLGLAFARLGIAKLFKGRDSVSYSPYGLGYYTDTDENLYFLDDGKAIMYTGPAVKGASTPDHSKYLVLYEDCNLFLYSQGDSNGVLISGNVSNIGGVTNQGTFFSTGENEHLYYYEYEDSQITDVGYENMEITYSAGRKSLVAINDANEMYLFSTTNMKSQLLCNVGGEIEVCCVADNGSNVIWSTQDGNTYSIYMMKNGVPERIGKITNPNEYSVCGGYFFNDDKSFLIYSPDSAQFILSNSDDIIDVVFPGVITYDAVINQDGQSIDSDDDNIVNGFYVCAANSQDSPNGGLYKISVTGDLMAEVEDMNIESSYFIKNGYVYYMNTTSDLVRKPLGKENAEVITTDINDFQVSAHGSYAYIVKSGGLYWWDTGDETFQLHLITSTFGQNDRLYLTDKDDEIYRIGNMQDIPDSFLNKGTVYQYTIGQQEKEIAKDITNVMVSDTEYVSAVAPFFRKHISVNDYNDIVEYGSLDNGSYKTLIANSEY